MLEFRLKSGCRVRLCMGDITAFRGDAIVNAANSRMLGGGGVDGAIHRAAGPALRKECAAYPDPGGVRCPTGHVRLTSGCELPARYVLHTVGPVFKNVATSEPLLQLAYQNCLTIANEKDYGIKSVAFPAISCGVFGYPVPDAAAVALGTCAAYAGALESVTFMLFGQDTFDMFAAAASDQAGTLEPVSPDKLSK